MRLTPAQIDAIKSTATAVLGDGAQVTLFGSRVNDTAKGGDVLFKAPNLLEQPIHRIAAHQGVAL